MKRTALEKSGKAYCEKLQTHQETLLMKQFREDSVHLTENSEGAVCDPINGHSMSVEYRTKMTDWMIEVTTSFKCA